MFKPYQTKNRFFVEKFDGGAQVVDIFSSMTLGVSSVNEANKVASFARSYVKRHGDIDLACFPYSMEQELIYDSPVNEPAEDERPWYFGANAPDGYPLYEFKN